MRGTIFDCPPLLRMMFLSVSAKRFNGKTCVHVIIRFFALCEVFDLSHAMIHQCNVQPRLNTQRTCRENSRKDTEADTTPRSQTPNSDTQRKPNGLLRVTWPLGGLIRWYPSVTHSFKWQRWSSTQWVLHFFRQFTSKSNAEFHRCPTMDTIFGQKNCINRHYFITVALKKKKMTKLALSMGLVESLCTWCCDDDK